MALKALLLIPLLYPCLLSAQAGTEAAATPPAASETTEPGRPLYQPGLVMRPDGTRIAYYVREGTGPTLLLLPGTWGDYRVFDALVSALSPDLRVVIVELRGQGGSWPPSLSPTMELLAEDVLGVADKLGLSRFYVGGHSLGAMVSIEVAGQRPDAVAGAIPLEGWTHHLVVQEAFDGAVTTTLSPEQTKQADANRARVRDRLTQEQADALSSVWKKWDGYPILEKTPVPILEIWGDRGKPRPSREKLRLPERPNIEVVWMAGASHGLLLERPAEVAEAINKFIAANESR
jgi:pimeloyl-ACP methyl ester carboxylesterase